MAYTRLERPCMAGRDMLLLLVTFREYACFWPRFRPQFLFFGESVYSYAGFSVSDDFNNNLHKHVHSNLSCERQYLQHFTAPNNYPPLISFRNTQICCFAKTYICLGCAVFHNVHISRAITYASCSHTGLYDQVKGTTDFFSESWANRRKNIRLVAEVVSDRQGQISRNKVDGHVQNVQPAIPNRKRSHIGLT